MKKNDDAIIVNVERRNKLAERESDSLTNKDDNGQLFQVAFDTIMFDLILCKSCLNVGDSPHSRFKFEDQRYII